MKTPVLICCLLIAAVGLSGADAAALNKKSRHKTTGILPELEGNYLGDFHYQSFDAGTNTLSAREQSLGRPIVVYRNADHDGFVAYEYNETGTSNMGAISCPETGKKEPCTAYFQSSLASSTWERWVIKDHGRTIESTFESKRDATGDVPLVWIGTFRKID